MREYETMIIYKPKCMKNAGWKRTKLWAKLTVGLFFMALCACGEKDDPVHNGGENEEQGPGQEQDVPSLTMAASEQSKVVPCEGGSVSVQFVSSDVWTVEVAAEAASWLHVSPTEGAAGECIVQLTVDGHEGEQPRVGILTFRSGELSRTVTVTQQEWVLLPGSDGVDEMPVEPW